jgi:hypothetical protein
LQNLPSEFRTADRAFADLAAEDKALFTPLWPLRLLLSFCSYCIHRAVC